ncbi:hypothetical protein BFG52_10690 [Acinetobacter larvae]|uniref:Uncharacterized protein n=2 Tax=Acinetobacter larvae TaxID=1789224 RepID=A0A1B2M0S3_9GAMM|nr:hypothetical protein BFG52_10690 [Acinetobacter larvae]
MGFLDLIYTFFAKMDVVSGFAISFVIVVILIIHNNIEATEDDKKIEKQLEHFNIKQLSPVIRLLCYYALYGQNDWNAEKIAYIRSIFEPQCKTAEDFEYLQVLLNEQTYYANIQLSLIARKNLDLASRQAIFNDCVHLLNMNQVTAAVMQTLMSQLRKDLKIIAEKPTEKHKINEKFNLKTHDDATP